MSCAELALRGGTCEVLVLAISFAVFGDCQLSCCFLDRVNQQASHGTIKVGPHHAVGCEPSMSGALRRELHRGCFWISAGQQCLARLAGLGVSGGGEGLASHLGQGSFVSLGVRCISANCGIAQFPSPSTVSVNKAIQNTTHPEKSQCDSIQFTSCQTPTNTTACRRS